MTYEDDPVTSPLCEVPGLPLGTIVEGKEGSTSGESETETVPEPPEPPPASFSTYMLKRDQTLELTKELEELPKRTSPDVDGGWAWVVFVSMFLIFGLNAGLLHSTGFYYVQMLVEYGKSRSYTAWMGSLINAFFMLGGPVSSSFIQRFGCRASVVTGSLIMVTGYIASAFAISLEMLFVTYGVIVACGMNFCYSGQIIALAQYFDKRHSLATSVAMLGIGLGIFVLSSVTELCIDEYGWRGGFLMNAGISLQIIVLGALVFPIRTYEEPLEDTRSVPGSISTIKGVPTSKSRVFFEKSLNDKSFSSLRLSAGASYLCHSLTSLHEAHVPNRRCSYYDPSLRSNQHSFCSRGSHLAMSSIRSNGYSFCTMRDSHAELSHFDLPLNQYSFHNRDSSGGEFYLRSNNQSFCSRRDSQAGVSGLMSNPHSFCNKPSQIDLNHQIQSEKEVECHKLANSSGNSGTRTSFLIREGDCDLSCCVEELDEPYIYDAYVYTTPDRSKCALLLGKLKLRTNRALCTLARNLRDHPVMDFRFWLMDIAFSLSMFGTLTFYIIYKDFAENIGVGEYYSMALSGIGIGDLTGRFGVGLLVSTKYVDPVFTYSVAMGLCSCVMVGHFFISNGTQFLVLTAFFGITSGAQNILVAVAPTMVFGKEKLVTVFGHILFLGGIGALIGGPIAGSIVERTGSYDGVVWLSLVSLAFGSFCLFICFLIQRKRLRQQTEESV